MSQLVTVEDQTTAGIDSTSLFNWVWCLDRQAKYHYGRSPWVEHGYAPPADVMLLPKGAQVPGDAWNIQLLDVSDVEGALGYHEGQQFKSTAHSVRALSAGGTPIAKVFCTTARQDGVDPLEVISHEMLEMLVNPYVANPAEVRKVLDRAVKRFYIVEVGDPVQGNGYDAFAPEGRHSGYTLADFAFPAWFAMAQTRPDLSFRDSVSKPFELAPQGYMSTAPEGNPNEWSQVYGSEHAPHTPDPDDPASSQHSPGRTARRHQSNRQLLELLPDIQQEMTHMADALAGIQTTETAEGTAISELLTVLTNVQAELAAKAGQTTVNPAEIATIEADMKTQVAEITAKLPKPEAPAGSGTPAAPTKAVYTHTGTGAIDGAWTPSGFETVPVAAVPAVPADPATGAPETPEVPARPAEPLYYFSGDTAPGSTSGAGPEWTPFTGSLQAVPAAS